MTFRFLLRASTALFCGAVASPQTLAQTALPPLTVDSPAGLIDQPFGASRLSGRALTAKRLGSNDSASLLSDLPGVSLYEAGGVSRLPAIHGMADDRVNISVNGMTIGSACPNHMNSPLSYIDPARVRDIQVIAGITPVGNGGDSIGGTIEVKTADPEFAGFGRTLAKAELSTIYRSVSKSIGGSVSGTLADDTYSLSYSGAWVRARNYEAGGSLGMVRSSEYESLNQAVSLAARKNEHLFVIEVGHQYIPYEGYPNQYMDMVDNRSLFVNGRYEGDFEWGKVEARAFWQGIDHEMNFLTDKLPGAMPMNTDATNLGYALKATLPLNERDTLRIGNEFHHFRLNDWWPPVAGSMMMGPNTFVNINEGHRDRLGAFAEWEAQWNQSWMTLAGGRIDAVWMNTGNVQAYSPMPGMMNPDAMAATAFNARGHARSDVNFDATLLTRFTPTQSVTYELGYALKNRSPNLYERYSWGVGSMASRMVGWFGDGNGYVGNLDLKPETAHTFAAAMEWKGQDQIWSLRIAPYYTFVKNYIGVTGLKTLTDAMGMPTPFAQLQFVNHDAEFYGVDLSGQVRLWNDKSAGQGVLKLAAGWVEGRNTSSGGHLYHIQPLNAKITLEHALGKWSSAAELQWVDDKSKVDVTRNEPPTAGYTLVNLRAGYDQGVVRFDVGIDNLFDKGYSLPLGGQSLGDYKATGILRAVPGAGRSFNLGVTVRL